MHVFVCESLYAREREREIMMMMTILHYSRIKTERGCVCVSSGCVFRFVKTIFFIPLLLLFLRNTICYSVNVIFVFLLIRQYVKLLRIYTF